MDQTETYQTSSYRLSDISVPQETSRLSRIASTFFLREIFKNRRMYDESGCFFVCNTHGYTCDCNPDICSCDSECKCECDRECRHCHCVDFCSCEDHCESHCGHCGGKCGCNNDDTCACDHN